MNQSSNESVNLKQGQKAYPLKENLSNNSYLSSSTIIKEKDKIIV